MKCEAPWDPANLIWDSAFLLGDFLCSYLGMLKCQKESLLDISLKYILFMINVS